jgi:hypothetical protein
MAKTKIENEILDAEKKAIDALSRYKFMMFGYWAGVWVHLNRISESRRKNPFLKFVKLAQELKNSEVNCDKNKN